MNVVNMQNKPIIQYDAHPFAKAFPRLQGEEYKRLMEDIKQNGQKLPILIYNNKILDGVARYDACMTLKITPIISNADVKDDVSAIRLLVSLNILRRHLTATQKAFAASEIATMAHGVTKAHTSGKGEITIQEAVMMTGASVAQVKRVNAVKKYGDEKLLKEVISGKKPLKDAAKQVSEMRATYAHQEKAEVSWDTSETSKENLALKARKRLPADRFVSVEEIRFKLLPLINNLIAQGQRSVAAISPPEVLYDATAAKKIIENW